MVITLSLFYYLYLAIVALACLFAFFQLYHLIRFGFFSFGTVFFIIIFIIVFISIIFFSWQAMQPIDWTTTINILETNDTYYF